MLVEYDSESDLRSSESAEEQVLGAAGHSPVIALLSQLNDDQREVLLLRIIADLPIDSVATIMKKSLGAVKQLQRRALLALKDQLAITGWSTP